MTVDEVRPPRSTRVAEVFGLELEELPAEDGAGLWPQPVHDRLAGALTARSTAPVLD